MALAAVIAGPFGAAWGSGPTSLGMTEDGIKLRQQVAKQLITSDSYGDSVIDGVFRGGQVFLTMVGIEYSAAIAGMWPYGTFGVMGQVGRLDFGSSIAQQAVLTAVAGTTAATVPATLTAAQTAPDENMNAELQFAARGRYVPITLRCYPYSSTGIRWFSTT
jgi:hypothetical protein